FRMHIVILWPLGLHRAEGSDAHMQGEEIVAQHCGHPRSEMQPGGRCGDCALLPREDRLISVAVGLLVVAAHIMWQGEMPVPVEIDGRIPAHETIAVAENL